MNDPKSIKRILNLISKVSSKAPNLSFGQIILNAIDATEDGVNSSLSNVANDILEEGLQAIVSGVS